MYSWLIQAANLWSPIFSLALGFTLQVAVQITLVSCCFRRQDPIKAFNDNTGGHITQSTTTKTKTLPTEPKKRSNEEMTTNPAKPDNQGNQQAPKPPANNNEKKKSSKPGNRGSKKGLKQMIKEKSDKVKMIQTKPPTKEPAKVKEGGKSTENDLKTIKSTESNVAGQSHTKMDVIPSLDADQGQEENKTGEKTAEIRKEAAKLKPRRPANVPVANGAKAKADELPTMDDAPSDWGSTKEKTRSKARTGRTHSIDNKHPLTRDPSPKGDKKPDNIHRHKEGKGEPVEAKAVVKEDNNEKKKKSKHKEDKKEVKEKDEKAKNVEIEKVANKKVDKDNQEENVEMIEEDKKDVIKEEPKDEIKSLTGDDKRNSDKKREENEDDKKEPDIPTKNVVKENNEQVVPSE